jgi:hypothetical protein
MSVTPETIRIEASSRWDALDLAQRLAMHHTYLVQLGDERWHVCVRSDGGPDEILGGVRDAAALWAAERGLASVLRVGSREIELSGRRP